MAYRLFIGVTTEQSTANLVPAGQLGARRYLALDSGLARQRSWGDGLLAVLGSRGVAVRSELWEGPTLSILLGRLKELVDAEPAVTWILGGGTKLHQVAIWECFHSREKGDDEVVYADPGTGRLHRFRFEDGTLDEDVFHVRASLTSTEIIEAFGRRIGQSHGPPEPAEEDLIRWRTDTLHRRALIGLGRGSAGDVDPEDQRTLREWNNTLIESCKADVGAAVTEKLEGERGQPAAQRARAALNTAWDLKEWLRALEVMPADPVRAFGERWHKYSEYFERLLAEVVRSSLGGEVELRMNVKVYFGKAEEQEHDVLLTLPNGTLLSIDAKTFTAPRKELDARLVNLRRSGGRMSRFVLALPFHADDLAIMPIQLAKLPFILREFRQAFVIVGKDTGDLWIERTSGPVVECEADAPGAVRCQSIENWLDGLAR